MKQYSLVLVLVVFACFSCIREKQASVDVSLFGLTSNGDSVYQYRLINPGGATMDVIDYGARVVRLFVPDRNGKLDDVVLGYDSIESYEFGSARFFGALIGRYANRIADGRFTLDSVEYQLTVNNAPNGIPCHLHGGDLGFDRVMWDATPFQEGDTVGVKFTRLSPDGEEGYPGNLDCEVRYSWTPDNIWKIEYSASTDKATIVNMSQHCYFNLKGEGGGTVLDNYITIYADSTTPNNEGFVPLGVIEPVEGTPLDFREAHTFLERIDQPNEHMRIMQGYSANWVLNEQSGKLTHASTLYEEGSGRVLETWTTEPGLLVYTGRLLSEDIIGKNGRPLSKYGGLILETIHYPDTPNNPHFPSCVLRPGEEYRSVTEFRFSTDKE